MHSSETVFTEERGNGQTPKTPNEHAIGNIPDAQSAVLMTGQAYDWFDGVWPDHSGY